jgi:hypothetical protein
LSEKIFQVTILDKKNIVHHRVLVKVDNALIDAMEKQAIEKVRGNLDVILDDSEIRDYPWAFSIVEFDDSSFDDSGIYVQF